MQYVPILVIVKRKKYLKLSYFICTLILPIFCKHGFILISEYSF